MENLKFETYSIEAFDSTYGTALNSFMTFDEAMTEIEENEISYFYTSMDENDVLEAIEEEKEVANQLGLELIFIDKIGIYIAICS